MNKIYFHFYTDRIGHMCSNTELFLREKYNPEYKYIGLVDDYISNQTILDMFSRRFCDKVIYNRFFTHMIHKINPKNYIFHYNFNPNKYEAFKGEPLLRFTELEEERGKHHLEDMGIDSWFVCFHARTPEYMNNRNDCHKDFYYHNYRDCSIQNQIEAMEYITELGGYAIRMGHLVSEPLQTNNPMIIDYATEYRNDFMDIYLPAKAKFFVGAGAGLNCVAYLFNTPCVIVNVTPLEYIDIPKHGLFIPKLVYSILDERYLTFKELLNEGFSRFERTEQFDAFNLFNSENTSEDILDVTKEMNMRLDGTWDEHNNDLQEKYWSLFKPEHRCYGSPMRIGSAFLKRYEDLIE